MIQNNEHFKLPSVFMWLIEGYSKYLREHILGILHVSGELPTYPSPNPTFFSHYHLEQNVGLGDG